MKTYKIAVIGGGGKSGQYLVRKLLEKGSVLQIWRSFWFLRLKILSISGIVRFCII